MNVLSMPPFLLMCFLGKQIIAASLGEDEPVSSMSSKMQPSPGKGRRRIAEFQMV